MMDSVGKKVINLAKITAAKAAITDLLKDIKKVADDELKYWNKSLAATGIDIKNLDKKYKPIDDVKKEIEKWVKDNAKEFTETFNNKIVSELTKCDKPTQMEISEKINNAIKDEQPKINDKLKDKLQKSYKQFLGEYRVAVKEEVEQFNFNGISLDDFTRIFEPMKNVLFGILSTLKTAGPRSAITGAAGGGLLASAPAIGKLTLLGVGIGSGLATVVSIAGVALLGVALVPLIPDIAEKIKDYSKKSKEQRENDLRNLIASGFKDKIQPDLEKKMLEVSENYYKSIISMIDQTNDKKEQNYKTVASVIENVTQTIDSINKNF